jgi:hypothetical protein
MSLSMLDEGILGARPRGRHTARKRNSYAAFVLDARQDWYSKSRPPNVSRPIQFKLTGQFVSVDRIGFGTVGASGAKLPA